MNSTNLFSTITSSVSDREIFISCNECIDSLGEYCWCWEAKEGDYLQVFIIVFMIILMYLAAYCLGYARSSLTIGGISEMDGFCNVDMHQIKSFRSDVRIISSKYDEEGSISGIPIPLYLILNAIIVAIYFAIKLIIFISDDPHYLSTINDDFNEQSWSEFYNARIILITTIYCHSFLMLHQNVSIYKETKDGNYKNYGTFINIILIICTIIFFIDFLGSIILMCIKYPLIITSLYHGCICILTMIGVAITCCCLFPLLVCYSKFISFLFTLFVCGSSINQPCGRFIRGISNGFVLITINYLYICVVLCFAFLFVGGPNYVIIYLNLSKNSLDLLIIYLYAIATCIGIIGFLIGVFITMYKQCNDKIGGTRSKSNAGYHHPRNNNTTQFEMQQV